MINNTTIPVKNGPQNSLQVNGFGKDIAALSHKLPEILFITSYPPRECGIATYSQDLVNSLNDKFKDSFSIRICALEQDNESFIYGDEIKYRLNTDDGEEFAKLVRKINEDIEINMVMIQHEFGFFKKKENDFYLFLNALIKPVMVVFHTVLPKPDELLEAHIQQVVRIANTIIVMTHASKNVLTGDYGVPKEKITVIPHGTHLVPHTDKLTLKHKYQLTGKNILSTFGLLSSGKSIETTLKALPAVIREFPDTLFLVIGKTHPSVVKQEGEKYRTRLEQMVAELQLQEHVRFINYFLPLPDLLEYLQLTDIYLFTSRDPNQAVSGTFSYAISCGCPVISTPIPHAAEVLKNDGGIIIDFENPQQLSEAIIRLFNDAQLRDNISSNGLHRMASTAWENAAIAHAMLFEKVREGNISLHYKIPAINLDHLRKMTTDFGIIQFSKINRPDIDSGYTLDDNARALIAVCEHYQLMGNEADMRSIYIYFNFLKYCLQPEGYFLNYVDEQKEFTAQNYSTNLEDSNGRAIWALGYLLYMSDFLPVQLIAEAESTIQRALLYVNKMHSTRAMAFVIKGLYYRNRKNGSQQDRLLIKELADRIVQMYRHEADKDWKWFESYLSYANSILPEAMLCAWLSTGEIVYKEIARSSFDFLLAKIFQGKNIKVISNKSRLHKDEKPENMEGWGEQPIDVAYTILALRKFYDVFREESYLHKMVRSFDWFLGSNHLHQVIYNPCTGGCYDGLEENYVNLNQGAESTVSYLMARLTIENIPIIRKRTKLQAAIY